MPDDLEANQPTEAEANAESLQNPHQDTHLFTEASNAITVSSACAWQQNHLGSPSSLLKSLYSAENDNIHITVTNQSMG